MLVNLIDYVNVISGGTPKTQIKEYWNGNIPWLTIDDFRDVNKYVYRALKAITNKGLQNSATNILHTNDIIISARGTVGKIALIYQDMAFNQSCFGLRVKDTNVLNPEYLFYYLKCNLPYILKKTKGAVFDTITINSFKQIKINLPSINEQLYYARIISNIDEQIERNNNVVKRLQVLGQAIFNRFFYSENNLISLVDFPYIQVIRPGIIKFENKKRYIATAEIEGKQFNYNAPLIEYETRENRANMQPISNSVWFAKMKNSIKHIYVTQNDKTINQNYIFSTGFCGIKCEEFAFEYMINYLNLSYFEKKKDITSHGATMESINNEDLKSFKIHLPAKDKLILFHTKTKEIYYEISRIRQATFQLTCLKGELLPLLINGQLK